MKRFLCEMSPQNQQNSNKTLDFTLPSTTVRSPGVYHPIPKIARIVHLELNLDEIKMPSHLLSMPSLLPSTGQPCKHRNNLKLRPRPHSSSFIHPKKAKLWSTDDFSAFEKVQAHSSSGLGCRNVTVCNEAHTPERTPLSLISRSKVANKVRSRPVYSHINPKIQSPNKIIGIENILVGGREILKRPVPIRARKTNVSSFIHPKTAKLWSTDDFSAFEKVQAHSSLGPDHRNVTVSNEAQTPERTPLSLISRSKVANKVRSRPVYSHINPKIQSPNKIIGIENILVGGREILKRPVPIRARKTNVSSFIHPKTAKLWSTDDFSAFEKVQAHSSLGPDHRNVVGSWNRNLQW